MDDVTSGKGPVSHIGCRRKTARPVGENQLVLHKFVMPQNKPMDWNLANSVADPKYLIQPNLKRAYFSIVSSST